VLAECAHVLRAVYEVPQPQIAALLRSALVVPSIRVLDPNLALRTLELYGMGFAFVDAYCVACAELSGVGAVASFDRELARRAPIEVIRP
jgi:predicted nucleic acid-binding protein